MLKALLNDLLIFGLSEENIKRLQDGKPIIFNLSELGLPPRDVAIIADKDEMAIQTKLENIVNSHNSKIG